MGKTVFLDVAKGTLRLRLLGALVLALALFLFQESLPSLLFAGGIVLYLIYIGVLYLWVIPRFYFPSLIYGMVLVDTALAVLLLAAFGVGSAAVIVLPLLIIFYAMHLAYIGSLLTATLGSLAYAAIVILRQEPGFIILQAAYQIPLFYLVAIFTGYLAQQRLKEREERLTLQEMVLVEKGTQNLLALVRTLQHDLSLEQTLPELVSNAVKITGFPHCVLALAEDGQETLVGRATTLDLKALGIRNLARLVPEGSESLARQSREGNLPRIITPKEQRLWPKEPYKLTLISPLSFDQRFLGALYFLADQDQALAGAQIAAAEGVADVAAAAIANAQRFEQLEHHSSQLLHELDAALRRVGYGRRARQRQALRFDGLAIEPEAQQVSTDGKPISLSPTEFEVLYFLAEHADQAVRPETLLREVWGEAAQRSPSVVDVCVHRLRKKLRPFILKEDLIATVRGTGYRFNRP
ncbi:MAG: winged helix-turn-helix transcriptional regulator [Chloroflexi bacterium]|nr:winged helix-turn-helix transcriptional regulator [Chloroflexota bacterium]